MRKAKTQTFKNKCFLFLVMVIVKKRKIRKDRKYKYRKKHGKMQPYYSKRSRSDPIKIWWWKEEQMSSDGIRRIPAHLRATAFKTVFKPYLRVDIDPNELSNKKKVENIALLTIGLEGEYLLKMWCKRKNKFHCSAVKVARVIIKEGRDGLIAELVENKRLNHYWFWEGRNRR